MVSRYSYGMTLLGNDVLVCGGLDLSSCALYNASINQWAAAATIQSLPVAMDAFPMITLHTRPYVFGGYRRSSGVVNTVYTLDTSNAWATRMPMKHAVAGHTAVALDANTALVCGGSNDGGDSTLSACFSYAATRDMWSPAAQMITARYNHGMAVYKSLFLADYDLYNCSGCAQVACLFMVDIKVQTFYHLLKCCRSTDGRGRHYQRPCLRAHIISRPCHCRRQKKTFNHCKKKIRSMSGCSAVCVN
jgi:hypothetical protein